MKNHGEALILVTNASSWACYSSMPDRQIIGIGMIAPRENLEISRSTIIPSASGGAITSQGANIQTSGYMGITCGGDCAELVDVTYNQMNSEFDGAHILDAENEWTMLELIETNSISTSGIYSTKQGTSGGQQNTPKSFDEVPGSIVGIVHAKASEENGTTRKAIFWLFPHPIYFAKGEDLGSFIGAIEGKAMTSPDSCKGIIEEPITLQ